MNISWAIKNFHRFKSRHIGSIVLIISLVFASAVLFRHFQGALGENGSPEKFTTDLQGNPKNSFKVGEQGLLTLKIYADDSNTSATAVPNQTATSQTSADLVATEKLASQVVYNDLVSSDDKGGTARATTVANSNDGKIILSLQKVPKSYVCDQTKSICQENGVMSGANYTIFDNYVSLVIKFTAAQKGNFDLDSNYDQCESGSPIKVRSESKVQYNFTALQSNKTLDFPSMCVSVGSGISLNIIKTTFLQSGDCRPDSQCAVGSGCIRTRKATFDAGEQVLVRLEVDEPEDSRIDYEIQEALPKTVSGDITYSFSRKDGLRKCDLKAKASNGQIVFSGSEDLKLLSGRNTIEYSYKI